MDARARFHAPLCAVIQVAAAVLWNKPETHFWVPVWIIILAVLVGLLLLALLIYLLYKVRGRERTILPYKHHGRNTLRKDLM